jgi:flagellar motor switch protein FliN/FliY
MAETDQAVEEKNEQENAEQENTEQAGDKTKAQNVDFPEAGDKPSAGPGGSIDILLDMNIPVTAVIGETQIPVRTLLQLGPGSVLKLDKSINEPADLYLRETRFATGKIVVVQDRFAIRIEEILTFEDSKDKETK